MEASFGIRLCVQVWQLLLRFWLQRSSLFWFNYATFIASNTVHFIAYSILKGAARPSLFIPKVRLKTSVLSAEPRYGPSGDLISGGTDLKMRGFVEYVTDAIILTIILQVVSVVGLFGRQCMSCFTDSGWSFRLGLVVDLNRSYVCWLCCMDLLPAIQHCTKTGHCISTPDGDLSIGGLL